MVDAVQVKEKREANREKYLPDFLLRRRGYICPELLGQGAFALVYTVEKQSEGRRYACKVSRKPELLEREARLLDKLRHPIFPEYVDFWEETGFGFLLREYVPGSSLEEVLQLQGALSMQQTVQIGLGLAEGLHYLHSLPDHYLFRDIKPANIILCQGGGGKLIDLGCVCAMEEASDAYAGTPGFAAPEQLSGDKVLTPSCDVYALGQTLKAALQGPKIALQRQKEKEESEALAGRKQQERRKVLQKWEADRKERRDRSHLMAVLDACTREEPSCRIPDMESLWRELSHIPL